MEEGGLADVQRSPTAAISSLIPLEGIESTELIKLLLDERKAFASIVQELREEIRQLKESKFFFNSSTNTPTPHQQPEPPTAPKPKRQKQNTATKPNIPANLPLPLRNAFSVLAVDAPLPIDQEEFPAPPATNNDPKAKFPTKTAAAPPAVHPKPKPKPNPPTTFKQTTPNANVPTPTPTPTQNDTVPPIILHDKDSWVNVSAQLNSQKFNYSRATNTREGIRITPSSIQDYRSIHSFLANSKLFFHNYQLPSEKTIKVVFRGVPQALTNEQIQIDLVQQNYSPLQITRLNGRNNRPAPLVHVEHKFQSIYNLKTLCGLDVTVEPKKIPSGKLQCHRCQRFGHTQPNCNAPTGA